MNIYIINETAAEVQIQGQDEVTALPQNAGKMFEVRVPDTLTIDETIVIKPNSNETVSVTDDDQQLCGIGTDFFAQYEVPDTSDFAFAIVTPGDGDSDGFDEEEGEATLSDLVIENLLEHDFRVTEVEDGVHLARDDGGSAVILRDLAQGILFQSEIKTRRLDDGDLGTLFACMNVFNGGSLLTKVYVIHSEATSVMFECWLPPVCSEEEFEYFFGLYLSEIHVGFDENLRLQLDEFLMR